MTVPMLYELLTPAEKAWMSNGCGPKLGVAPDLVPEFVFHAACERHDYDYWRGFTETDRATADKRFLDAMLAAAKRSNGWWSRRWYAFLAWRYYSAVRLFGKSAFSYRLRYATHEDLVREMAADP